MSEPIKPRQPGGDDDWHAVAVGKLTRVLGAHAGEQMLREALAQLGLDRLQSAGDLHRLAQILVARGGFAGAVGGLLSVHATMYGAHVEQPRSTL